MDRWLEPDINEYDILGVSPDASDEEIKSAFHWLIEEQGYRVGVPLRKQWQRAREIQAAYETLGDPAKRRAYDETLSQAAPPSRVPQQFDEPTMSDRVADPIEPEPAPPRPIHLTLEDIAPLAHREPTVPANDPLPPDDDAAFYEDSDADDDKRFSARHWGLALVTVLAVGLLVPLLPHSSAPPPDTLPLAGAERDAQGPASAQQTSLGGLLQPSPERTNTNGGGPSTPQQSAQAGGTNVAKSGSQVTEAQPGTAGVSAVRGAAEPLQRPATEQGVAVAEAPATAPQTESAAPPAPTVPVIAPAPSPAPAQVVAPAPRAPSVTRTAGGAALSALPAGSAVGRPARWIGGGPTHADNRRGRYRGTVDVQFTVEPNGRVSRCAPTRGSGNAELDAVTCRLVQQRTRFQPALDDQGRPIASQASATYVWRRTRRN